MNPPQVYRATIPRGNTVAPSTRFFRGRGRGKAGGSPGPWRPYFYVRRGRGKKNPSTGANFHRGGVENFSNSLNRSLAITSNDSFLRPDFYAAPADGIQVPSFSIDNPLQCPGWRLYYTQETFDTSSDLFKRIETIQEHIKINSTIYNLELIAQERSFQLSGMLVLQDAGVTQSWPDLQHDLKEKPEMTLSAFGVSIHSLVTTAVIEASAQGISCSRENYVSRDTQVPKIHVRPTEFLPVANISSIDSEHYDRLFCARGCITAVGAVDVNCTWIAHRCSHCGHNQVVRQTGYYTVKPITCLRSECHSKKTFVELRSSPYTRIEPVQIVRLLENHLQAVEIDADHPYSIDVELRDDLVDAVCIGDDVIVTGILKVRPLNEEQVTNSTTSKAYKLYLQAMSVTNTKCNPVALENEFSEKDLEAIKMISEEPCPIKLLVQSLAPEVYGQEMVKAGLLLSLFGGAGSQVHDDGDINVLLVGDPGVGKSYLIEKASKLSERGTYVNGKRNCSSGLGGLFTATVKGKLNHSFDAGALLTSNGGHCSIDDIDRLASYQETLLQVLQTHTLSLVFSGASTCLAVPSTIIATANSIRGHYDRCKLVSENIRLNPSLFSQFHLVFVLLDKPDKDLDSSLTEHIKALHSGMKKSSTIAAKFALKPKTNNSMNMDDDPDVSYELSERLKINSWQDETEQELDLLPPILVKKYIAYARQKVKPLLDSEAVEDLKEFYLGLRKEKNDANSTTISTSQMEGLIRLTQARARIDLCTEATKQHVRDVISIVRQSIADTSVSEHCDVNPANIAASSQGSQAKKFIRMLQLRSNALGRRIFEFDELKDMARHAGISCGVTNLVEIVNLQGFLLKKGANLYEVMEE